MKNINYFKVALVGLVLGAVVYRPARLILVVLGVLVYVFIGLLAGLNTGEFPDDDNPMSHFNHGWKFIGSWFLRGEE